MTYPICCALSGVLRPVFALALSVGPKLIFNGSQPRGKREPTTEQFLPSSVCRGHVGTTLIQHLCSASKKRGTVPVYLLSLLNHQTKVLDTVLMCSILHEAMYALPDTVKQARVYSVDIYDRAGVEAFIKEQNVTDIKVGRRDLKEILDKVALNDEVEFQSRPTEGGGQEIEIVRFAGDRLQQKISEYNQKKGLTGKAKPLALERNDSGDEDGQMPTARKKTPSAGKRPRLPVP